MSHFKISSALVFLLFGVSCGSGIYYQMTPATTPGLASLTLTPASGPIGTLVTISGTDLSAVSSVTVSGVSALPLSSTSSVLTAMIMPGTVSGSMSVTTATGIFLSSGDFTVTATGIPMAQQGDKLVGIGTAGAPNQGASVAVSADGNTALVGGNADGGTSGATWVFTRSGGNWTQQGGKLQGSLAAGLAQQGTSVALSADGNTALVGGNADGGNSGATWVFTRSGSTWTQQGGKLVGALAVVGGANQGTSVALSADGNTALVGGPTDNASTGAVWIFTRSGSTWSQQGGKLVGSFGGGAQQGTSVALSADGNTALVGGPNDGGGNGAVWIFTRSGDVWTQQGGKLAGNPLATAQQGTSVALSADGNTALVGGDTDNAFAGAVWVFTRSGGIWSQQGDKLVGTPASPTAQQGKSVALSADGNTALVGGDNDGLLNAGAVWVFTRSGGVWSQHGGKLVGSLAVGGANQGTSVALSADGNTALSGGLLDNSNFGATWVFTP